QRRPACEIGHIFDMTRSHHSSVVDRNIHEHFIEFYVLLCMGVYKVMILKARDRQYRRPIQLRIIKSIDKMKTAWTRGCKTYAKLAGVFRIGACHEGGRLLVPHLNESDPVGALSERLHDSIDAVPR